jgi:glycosyltransferase involved in cell wall biosynthesis
MNGCCWWGTAMVAGHLRAPSQGRASVRSIPAMTAGTPRPAPAKDTVVFIPAWNEERALPGVIAEVKASLRDADLLVIDDGSTDATAAIARGFGATVVSFERNRGLRAGIAEGYRQALVRGYEYCGRLDADGQHPAAELVGMLELVRSGACDVAIGSRFLPESGKEGVRYKPAPERVIGTSLLRLLMRLRLGQPISDGTSGLYAVNRSALALLADDYLCEAPEVEALVRITQAKLRLIEVPVHMRQREHGESSFRGKRAAELVITIGLALFASEALRRRHIRHQRKGLTRALLRRG